jgi:pimeloyl-ACP methyl ester carboxylesterase
LREEVSVDINTLEDRYASLNGVRLHYVEAGHGPLVVLLHGFPDHWRVWRHVIGGLAAAGYHVVAPDMRGYNLSDKPTTKGAYAVDAVAGDIAALIDQLAEGPATLVGHDWGGVVAWYVAIAHAAKLTRLMVLNAPHPFFHWAQLPAEQWLRSYYIAAFQLPVLPEWLFSAFDFALLRESFKNASRHAGRVSDADIEANVRALAQPGALEAALGYYRAVPSTPGLPTDARVEMPVEVLWGDQDPFIMVERASPPPGRVPHFNLHRRRDSGHWIQLDEPEWVIERIIAFCKENKQ